MVACDVSLNDLADRAPRALQSGEVIDLGGKRMRWIDTPHVPHGWEAGVFYEETGGTLFCGDLFTHTGDPAALTESDISGPAIGAEAMFRSMSLAPGTMREARDVLREHGNMSAVTVLFVLERMLKRGLAGRHLMSALGPGFSAGFQLLEA